MKNESSKVVDKFFECFEKHNISLEARKELIKLILEFQKAINIETIEIIENWREK